MQQAPDDGVRRPLHDLEHAPLGPALAVLADYPDLDLVLVQHGAHLVGRQVDVRAAVVADQKTVSITVPLHRSFNFIQQTAGSV